MLHSFENHITINQVQTYTLFNTQTPISPRSFFRHKIYIYTTKYNAVNKLGPTNNPNQKIVFPNTTLPLMTLLLLRLTSGNCASCIQNKYPRTFLNMTAMHISCTRADSRKVTKVAACRLRWKVEMEEW